MPISPLNAVSRNLTWKDFAQNVLPAPGPNEVVTAAQTATNAAVDQINVDPVKGTKPTVYKLTREPTVTVTFEPTSWVASFVSSWPQNQQDDLLMHEQVHYLIAALSGRDFVNAAKVIGARTYPTAQACIDDIKVEHVKMDCQDIQDKYDVDTKHRPTQNAAIQAKWTTAVIGARANGLPLRPQLQTAGLIP